VDVDDLAATLQRDGAEAFVASWRHLMERITAHTRAVA
jgi:hypothetical protein